MTSYDAPPPGDPQPGQQPPGATGSTGATGATGATAVDDGPRVTRDDVTDLGRLRRSRTDRHVAGVAGGLARHLDIDPIIVRVVLVITSFFGGAGLLAYAALWLLVPEDGEERAPINLDEKARTVALVFAGALAAVALLGDSWGGQHWGGGWFPWPLVLIGLLVWLVVGRQRERRERHRSQYGTSRTGWVGPPAADPGEEPTTPYAASPYAAPPHATSSYAAPPRPPAYPTYASTPPPRPRDPRKRGPVLFWATLALVALGIGVLGMADLSGAPVVASAYPALAVGITGLALVVGAVWGRAGGLIPLGLLLTLPLVGATAAGNIDDEVVEHHPLTASQVSDRYWNDAGEMVVDLTAVTDVDELDGRTVTVEGGVGRLTVLVPDGVDVVATADVEGPGAVDVLGQEHGGIDVFGSGSLSAGTDQPTLEIVARLGVGEIVILQ